MQIQSGFIGELESLLGLPDEVIIRRIDALTHSYFYDGKNHPREAEEVKRDMAEIIPGLLESMSHVGDDHDLMAIYTYALFSLPQLSSSGQAEIEVFDERRPLIDALRKVPGYEGRFESHILKQFRRLDDDKELRCGSYYSTERAAANVLMRDEELARSYLKEINRLFTQEDENHQIYPGYLGHYILLLCQKACLASPFILGFDKLKKAYDTDDIKAWEGIIETVAEGIGSFYSAEETMGTPDEDFSRGNFFNLYEDGWGLHQTFHNRYDPKIMRRLRQHLPNEGKGSRMVFLDAGSSGILTLLDDLENIGWKGDVMAADMHPWQEIFPYVVHRAFNWDPHSFTERDAKEGYRIDILNPNDFTPASHEARLARAGIDNIVVDLAEDSLVGCKAEFINSTGCVTNTIKREYRLKAMRNLLKYGHIEEGHDTGTVFNWHGYCIYPLQLIGAFSFVKTHEGYEAIRMDIDRLEYVAGEHSLTSSTKFWFSQDWSPFAPILNGNDYVVDEPRDRSYIVKPNRLGQAVVDLVR